MSGGARKVWITRTQPGAAATAARVANLGLEPLVAPLLEVRFLAPEVDLSGVCALAFTSVNGVQAFAGLSGERGLPAWAVGEATAEAARAAGFAQVRAAAGDVAALTEAIAADSPAGLVLHLSAHEPARDLAADLTARGTPARRLVVYETVATPLARDPEAVAEADLVLLHSPRAAGLLTALVARRPRPALSAVCLSPAVAAALGGSIPARAAPTPDEAALLALLKETAR